MLSAGWRAAPRRCAQGSDRVKVRLPLVVERRAGEHAGPVYALFTSLGGIRLPALISIWASPRSSGQVAVVRTPGMSLRIRGEKRRSCPGCGPLGREREALMLSRHNDRHVVVGCIGHLEVGLVYPFRP